MGTSHCEPTIKRCKWSSLVINNFNGRLHCSTNSQQTANFRVSTLIFQGSDHSIYNVHVFPAKGRLPARPIQLFQHHLCKNQQNSNFDETFPGFYSRLKVSLKLNIPIQINDHRKWYQYRWDTFSHFISADGCKNCSGRMFNFETTLESSAHKKCRNCWQKQSQTSTSQQHFQQLLENHGIEVLYC